MATQTVQTKLRRLETELATLKRMIARPPDYQVDEENWTKLRPALKQVRRSLYRDVYQKKTKSPRR